MVLAVNGKEVSPYGPYNIFTSPGYFRELLRALAPHNLHAKPDGQQSIVKPWPRCDTSKTLSKTHYTAGACRSTDILAPYCKMTIARVSYTSIYTSNFSV